MNVINPAIIGLMFEAFELPSRSTFHVEHSRTAHENELAAQRQLDELLEALHGVNWAPSGNGRYRKDGHSCITSH